MPDGTVPLSNGSLLLSALPSGALGQIIALIVLVLLSGFFSSTETAFSCANKIKLRSLASNGDKKAERVLALIENNFEKLISTILVGNNIVNLSAATISAILFENLLRNTGLSSSVISTAVITVAVLIFGEIIPKFIAKVQPEKMTLTFYPLIMCFYYIFYPLNLLFGGLKFVISKLFKVQEDVVTEDEILTIVEEAEEDGTLKEEETELIRSVIEFDDLEVMDILVPRVNMVAVSVTDSLEEIKEVFEKEGYSRLPVYRDTIDTVIGIIHQKDFFNAYLEKKENLNEIIQPIQFTTEHVKISKLLKLLQKQKTHMALVLDEYGGTLGLVTLEDILEELVGEIWDEHDEEINYFKENGENCYIVDGNAPIEDVLDKFEVSCEEEFDSNTLSGFIIEQLGEIPRVNKKFVFCDLQFIVLKSTVKRVLSVKITKLEKTEE